MRTIISVFVFMSLSLSALAQVNDSTRNIELNAAEKLLSTEGNLTIGGYGEIHYNQGLDRDFQNNGKLDVHRMVMLFGYRFNDRTQFITEIEYEHVKEVYIEQAFLQYRINRYINFRAGLLLVPMGIINEYHEPTTFHGVERPLVDKYIAPTTWREIGLGFNGTYLPASLKYQVYLMNGFNSYDGSGVLKGSSGLRKGRQKGAESFMSSPNLSAKIEYFGIGSLTLGLSGYFGNTQSTLYNGLDKNDETAKAMADSSVVGMAMIGADARYTTGGLNVKAQYYFTKLSNTEAYNQFTSEAGLENNLGSVMTGYYVEAAYDLFHGAIEIESELLPFMRYETFNTHADVAGNLTRNETFDNQMITAGLNWKMARGAVLKADMQFRTNAATDEYTKVFNMGVGVFF